MDLEASGTLAASLQLAEIRIVAPRAPDAFARKAVVSVICLVPARAASVTEEGSNSADVYAAEYHLLKAARRS